MISLFQHTALLRRPLEVTHLSAEGGSQEKRNRKKCFPKAACAGGVGQNKKGKLTPQCPHLQNPGGNHAGLGTDSLRAVSAGGISPDCHDHPPDFAANLSFAMDESFGFLFGFFFMLLW